MRRSTDVNPVEFGRVIGHLESLHKEIRELKERTIYRLDNLEDRVEIVEQEQASKKFLNDIVYKGILGLLTSALLFFGLDKYFGH